MSGSAVHLLSPNLVSLSPILSFHSILFLLYFTFNGGKDASFKLSRFSLAHVNGVTATNMARHGHCFR